MFERLENWFTTIWWTKGWVQFVVIFTLAPLAFILLCAIWFIPIM